MSGGVLEGAGQVVTSADDLSIFFNHSPDRDFSRLKSQLCFLQGLFHKLVHIPFNVTTIQYSIQQFFVRDSVHCAE